MAAFPAKNDDFVALVGFIPKSVIALANCDAMQKNDPPARDVSMTVDPANTLCD
jgi:hypothetical protein